MRISPLAVALMLVLVPLQAAAQVLYLDPQFGFARTTVVYTEKPVGGPPAVLVDLHLELFQPTGPGVPDERPAVVAIHGGGFTGGSRLSPRILDICEALAVRGWTCVSIDYRLAGDMPWISAEYLTLESIIAAQDPTLATPIAAATEDTVAALVWLDTNAESLGIDPARIGLAGYSAGGVLTELVGYVAADTGVTLPVPVRATFNMSGSFDPVTAVQPSEPPVIISHGNLDGTVPVEGALDLAAAAAAAGVAHELHVFAGRGHTDIDVFSEEVAPGETLFERFVGFFHQHVAGATAVPTLAWGLRPVLAGLLAASALVVVRGRWRAGPRAARQAGPHSLR